MADMDIPILTVPTALTTTLKVCGAALEPLHGVVLTTTVLICADASAKRDAEARIVDFILLDGVGDDTRTFSMEIT